MKPLKAVELFKYYGKNADSHVSLSERLEVIMNKENHDVNKQSRKVEKQKNLK